MLELSKVSETLYVPLVGRAYISIHYPDVLHDNNSLKLSRSLSREFIITTKQTEYRYLSSAVRSKNVDIAVQKFLAKNPKGTIVNVGCGLETAFSRNYNGQCKWFELDFKDVLTLRHSYLPKAEGEYYLSTSMFDYKWIDRVKEISSEPVFVIVAGVFYYYKKAKVIEFIKALKAFGDVELIFDTVSNLGLKLTKHSMKKIKKDDAKMDFHINNVDAFIKKISPETKMIEHKGYFSEINKTVFKASTRFKMCSTDKFNLVRMVHLKL